MTQVSLAKIIADFETSLATKIDVGGTTATLQAYTDDDGVALPTGRYFFTIDGNNSSKEHIAATLGASGALTAIKTVSRQGTETSGVVRSHRVGAKVVITDFAHIKKINDLLDGTTNFDPSVVLGYSGTASISSANQFATKDYVDGVTQAGASDASVTVKGIARLSTGPVSATGPIVVGDNDPRLPTQSENDALVGTSGSPSSTNKFVTSDDVSAAGATGKIIRATATGLPAMDGSALTGMPTTTVASYTSTGSNSYSVSSSAKKIFVQLWGGGGSGGKGNATNGGGGGGGEYKEVWLNPADLSSPVTITVGTGGASRTVTGTSGEAGTSSTFGSYARAVGGSGGGSAAGSDVTGGNGGTEYANINGLYGNAGTTSDGQSGIYSAGGGGTNHAAGLSYSGGASYFGGAGGGAAGSISGNAGGGGTSVKGGNGGAGAYNGNATAGSQPGGGGGGNGGTGSSGAGGNGKVIVTTFF